MDNKYNVKDFEKVENYYNNKMNSISNLTNIIMDEIKQNNKYNDIDCINKLQMLDNIILLLEEHLLDISNNNSCNSKKTNINKSDLNILFPILYNYFK